MLVTAVREQSACQVRLPTVAQVLQQDSGRVEGDPRYYSPDSGDSRYFDIPGSALPGSQHWAEQFPIPLLGSLITRSVSRQSGPREFDSRPCALSDVSPDHRGAMMEYKPFWTLHWASITRKISVFFCPFSVAFVNNLLDKIKFTNWPQCVE